MSTTIKLRRSAVPGRVPTTSQLDLGELAINTADGKIYFKQYDPVANTESIVDVSTNLDANAILDLLIGVDGANSGLDADLLDGQDGSYYLDWDNFTNTATGVSANTYGSASEVPVLTIDEDGRITAANTVTVAGVSNTYWDSSNNTYTIETADGGIYNTIIEDFSGLNIEGNAGKIRFNSTVAPEITNQDDTVRLVMFGDGYTPNTAQLYLYADTDVWVDTDLTVSGDINTTQDISANNIVVTGLVDGRDIAADGAKLDLLEDGLDLTLTGKVTGFASSNTGVMTLTTELANTGVVANTYGSTTEIPVLTIDEDGRITEANTAEIVTTLTVTLEGDVTGSITSSNGNLTVITDVANTGVTPGTYGNASQIPIVTVDLDGRITSMSNTAVAGVESTTWYSSNNTFEIETGNGSQFLTLIDTFSGTISANNISVSGTVDGRDVSVDGTKLDGIEDNATADQTPTEILNSIKTVDGPGSGLNADLLDGQHASDIIATAVSESGANVGNGLITITANNGLVGSGSFFLNDFSNTSIEFIHANTSSAASANNADGTVVQDVIIDTFGHVTRLGSTNLDDRYYTETELDGGQLDNRYYTETELDGFLNDKADKVIQIIAGDGLTGGGDLSSNVSIVHANTSDVANVVSVAEKEVINEVTFDQFGHVVTANTKVLDFISQDEADIRYVNVTGDTMTGNLEVQGVISQNESEFRSLEIISSVGFSTTLFEFPKANYDAAEVVVLTKSGINKHITKLLIVHDGTTAYATEYGVVTTSSELRDFDVQVQGNNVQLIANAAFNTVTFKVFATLIAS